MIEYICMLGSGKESGNQVMFCICIKTAIISNATEMSHNENPCLCHNNYNFLKRYWFKVNIIVELCSSLNELSQCKACFCCIKAPERQWTMDGWYNGFLLINTLNWLRQGVWDGMKCWVLSLFCTTSGLTYWYLRDVSVMLEICFSSSLNRIVPWAVPVLLRWMP